MSQQRITFENYTNDLTSFFEFLSLLPENKMPKILNVEMKRGDTTVTLMMSKHDFNELSNYVKNNR